MKIERKFTKVKTGAYGEIEFKTTVSEIRNPDGSVVFALDNLEVPAGWSQVAADVIAHPDVDAVFILTRHNLHAALVVQALEAGKHVFTEKPLALDQNELDRITAARAAAQRDVMVGFNRRFAPLAVSIIDDNRH